MRGFVLKLGAALSVPAVGLFVEKVAEDLAEIQHFADTVHLGADEIAAWNRVAADNLVPADSMQDSIRGLTRATGQAALGFGRGAAAFKHYGINAKDAHGKVKDFAAITDELMAKMRKQSPQETQAMFGFLRIDPKLIPLLEKGSDAVHKMLADARAANPLKPEDYRRSEEITQQFRAAHRAVQTLYRLIAISLYPVVEKVLGKFLEWIKTIAPDKTNAFNRALVTLGQVAESIWEDFDAIADALAPFVRWVSDTVPVRVMKDALYLLAAAIIAVGVGILYSTGSAAIGGVLAMGSAIAALCKTGIGWLAALTVAEWAAFWPLLLIAGAVAGIGYGAYRLYKGGIGSSEVSGFGPSVGDVSNSMQAAAWVPGTNSMQAASWVPGNVLHNRATTIVHHISGTTIHVSSPDPARAGESVQQALRPRNTRSLIRNAQSGKAI